MTDPRDWDEAYILNNLSTGENDRMEFKGRREVDLTLPGASDVHREGLSKALSAFANSGGGVLVLGIHDRTRQVDDGGIHTTIKPNGTKAWLEDLLPQLVDPPLHKLNVYEIIKGKQTSQLGENRALYIVEIGDSSLAPHQSVVDYKYYGRVAGKSRPLGHRMVLDILNRRQYPNLEISFAYAHVNDEDPNLHIPHGRHWLLNVQIENKGPVLAQFVNSILYIPRYVLPSDTIRSLLGGEPVSIDSDPYIKIIRENVSIETTTTDGQIVTRGPGRYIPILPGRIHSWGVPLIDDFSRYTILHDEFPPLLKWELYADNAPSQNGQIAMRKISGY